MNILVTDGNSRATLAITRSLGKKGHRLFVSAPTASSLAACSRYCYQALVYPDPTVDRSAFLQSMQQLLYEHDIDLLIPVTDVCVLPIAEHKELFENICRIPLPSFAALKKAADKSYLLQCAEDLGVATPFSISINNCDEVHSRNLDLELPVVIKPSRSRVQTEDGWVFTNIDYAHSNEELREKLVRLPKAVYPVLLQERISGPGIGHFYCFRKGEPVASFAHRRLREKPPSGGVSVLRESVALHPQAHEFSLKLLRKLNWHGVAMVEFKLDKADQIPKLMEINGRFWGSLQLAIDAGVDFPDLLVRIAHDEEIAYREDYKLGIRSRWLWGDVDLLLMHMFKSRTSLKLPEGHDSCLVSIIKILNPFVRKQRFEVLRLIDPKPWLHESIQWFRD